jgi:hypothetical protein
MSVTDVVAFVVLFAVFAVVIGGCLLLLRVSLRLLALPRPATPGMRRQTPPDDWDDEEYSARHHH